MTPESAQKEAGALLAFASEAARAKGMIVADRDSQKAEGTNGVAPAAPAPAPAEPPAGLSPQPPAEATPAEPAELKQEGRLPSGVVKQIQRLKAQRREAAERAQALQAELADLRSKMSTSGQTKQGNETPVAPPAAPPPVAPTPTTPPEEPALDQHDEEVEQLKAERRVARALGLAHGPQLDAVVKVHRDHDLDPKDALAVAQGRHPDLFPKETGPVGAGFAAAVPMQPRGLSPQREPPKPVDPREALRQRANDPRLPDAERARANIELLDAEILPFIKARQLG